MHAFCAGKLILRRSKMKKLFALILATLMVMSLAACGGNTPVSESVFVSPDEVLNKIFDAYAEENKFFAMGGDYTNMVDGKAGAVDVTKAEDVDALFHVPADALANVEAAASLMHAMNQNTFTAVAYQLKDGTDATAFANTLKDNFATVQWMCGIPEQVLAVRVDSEYVIVAFGATDVIETFKTTTLATIDTATVIYDEALAI